MAIWPNEGTFDNFITTYSLKYKVPKELIKAVIAKESSFNPKAYRAEPKIGDASRGLMQVLERTAKNLGFTENVKNLFDPSKSIQYGTKLLAENLERAKGNVDIAISAYNAGFSAKRAGDAKRKPNWEFINKEYVDDVKVYYAYFQNRISEAEIKQYMKTKTFAFIIPPVFF
jgi:soluble lytic murein transglycosylase-like protein